MGCTFDHASDRNPTHHPRWGLVPALSSTVIGALAAAALLVVSALWLPVVVTVLLLTVLGAGLLVSATAQAFLGHRGRCWAERSIRWWLGPVGSVVDPFDVG